MASNKAGQESMKMWELEGQGKETFRLAWKQQILGIQALVNMLLAVPADDSTYGELRRHIRRMAVDMVERELWSAEPEVVEGHLKTARRHHKRRLQELVSMILGETTCAGAGDGQQGESVKRLVGQQLLCSMGQALGLKSWCCEALTATALHSAEELQKVLQGHLPELAKHLAAYRKHQDAALKMVCEALDIFIHLKRAPDHYNHYVYDSFIRHGSDWAMRILLVRCGALKDDMQAYKNHLHGLVSQEAKSRIMNHIWYLFTAKQRKFSEAAGAEQEKRKQKKLEKLEKERLNLADGGNPRADSSVAASSWEQPWYPWGNRGCAWHNNWESSWWY